MLRLKALREAHEPRLSQEALAHLAGLSLATVQRAERRGDVNMRSLRRLARALGVQVAELFDKEPAA